MACLHNVCIDNNLYEEQGEEQAGNNAVEQVNDDTINMDGHNPAVVLRGRLIDDVFG